MTCLHRPRWPNGHMVESLSLSLEDSSEVLSFIMMLLLQSRRIRFQDPQP